jgi:hypothetical protein
MPSYFMMTAGGHRLDLAGHLASSSIVSMADGRWSSNKSHANVWRDCDDAATRVRRLCHSGRHRDRRGEYRYRLAGDEIGDADSYDLAGITIQTKLLADWLHMGSVFGDDELAAAIVRRLERLAAPGPSCCPPMPRRRFERRW